MFWLVLLLGGGAVTFMKLGMYSAWFKIMQLGMMAMVIVILFLTAKLIWRGLSSRR